MLILLIDTSTERGLVALLENTSVLQKQDLPFGYNNSKFLMPAVEQLLKESNTSMENINLIAATHGPGSYTGIRVGAITAKSLSFAKKIPLVGVCSLEGFIPTCEGPFLSLIDAKIGGAYILKGNKKRDFIEFTGAPVACPIDRLEPYLKKVSVIVTPNAEGVRKKVQEAYPHISCRWEECCPNPQQLAKSSLEKFHSGKFSVNGEMELLYLRKTQAEIEREEQR